MRNEAASPTCLGHAHTRATHASTRPFAGQDTVGSGSASSASAGKRGWRLLRAHWQDFLQKRGALAGGLLDDVDLRGDTERDPARMAVTKEATSRALERIIALELVESPRFVGEHTKNADSWRRCGQLYEELHAAFAEVGWPPKQKHRSRPAGGPEPHEKFLPRSWQHGLTDETLAELAVEALMDTFCDALLDGAVMVADAELWPPSPRLGRSASSPAGALSSLPPIEAHPRELSYTHPPDPPSRRPQEGFTMAGLSLDRWEAWNNGKYHPCRLQEPYTTRITQVADLQRPQRRPGRCGGPSDQRKFLWPMTATNFPEAWEEMTKKPEPKPRGLRSAEKASRGSAHPGRLGGEPLGRRFLQPPRQPSPKRAPPIMTVDSRGRTSFPYSLVLHRAFLDSQPDVTLKDKAKKQVPLVLTSTWD